MAERRDSIPQQGRAGSVVENGRARREGSGGPCARVTKGVKTVCRAAVVPGGRELGMGGLALQKLPLLKILNFDPSFCIIVFCDVVFVSVPMLMFLTARPPTAADLRPTARTCPISDFWSNFTCFGFKIYFLKNY